MLICTDCGSVGSYAPTSSSSLAAQRYHALSNINQARQSTKSGLLENNHSRSHSLDLGIEQTAVYSSNRNSDVDYSLSGTSNCKSNLSDGEFWNYYQNPTVDVSLATLPPDKQVPLLFLLINVTSIQLQPIHHATEAL